MATAINVNGACQIKVGTGVADALEELGYSINGVQIYENAYYSDVPGDENGGDEGPPIDIQIFGRVDRVRMELSKWDDAIADEIRSRANDNGATGPGDFGVTSGSLMSGGSYGYRLVLITTNNPRNYLFAIPRQPLEMNSGTKYSRLVIEWECHAVSGTLYNTTTS